MSMMCMRFARNRGDTEEQPHDTHTRDGLYTTKISLAPGIRRGGASEGHSEGHSGGFDFMESYTDTEFSYQKHSTRTIIALIIAIVIVAAILGGVLFSMYVFNESSNIEASIPESTGNVTLTPQQSLDKASDWLILQRDSNYGWTNTPQSLIGLRFGKPEWFLKDQTQSALSIKQMEIEIYEHIRQTKGQGGELEIDGVTFTDIPIPFGKLATYINARAATCQEPGGFDPYNMLKSVERDMNNYSGRSDIDDNYYYFSLGLLALCNSNAKIPVELIEKMKSAQLPNGGYVHGLDATSMVVVALSCLSRGKKLKTEPEGTIDNATNFIMRHLRDDGSFGSALNTANAVQALLANGMDPDSDIINNALVSIVDKQKSDRSFGSTVTTAMILPALAKKSYIDIKRSIECEALPTQSDDGLIDVKITLATDVEDANITELTYEVRVMAESNLYDVLHKLKDQHSDEIVEYKDYYGDWGHSIWSINHHEIMKTETHQKFWVVQLEKDTVTSLSINDVVPSDGDRITVLYTSVTLPEQ